MKAGIVKSPASVPPFVSFKDTVGGIDPGCPVLVEVAATSDKTLPIGNRTMFLSLDSYCTIDCIST